MPHYRNAHSVNMRIRDINGQKHQRRSRNSENSPTLSVFGVGRRPLGAARGAVVALLLRLRRRPEVYPLPSTVHSRSIRSPDDIAATKRRTMSRLSVCGAQHGISGHFPDPSNYFRWINSTSGLGTAPETEPQSTPVHDVQQFRHSAVVFEHFPGILHFPGPKWRL